ncbi:MAG: NAD-dependent epimerase/dehydratase family protein [Lachnospiraceae bacterium]|nr:NAD-dependent epimerase/dehydratase family protein [Lachnospiraceae bacterium]
METILITGNTGLFTAEQLKKVAAYYRVVLAGRDVCSVTHKNIRTYTVEPEENKFGNLFDAYNFHAVWYLSGYADGGAGLSGGQQYLEKTLAECGRTRVESFILISGTESRNFRERQETEEGGTVREYATCNALAAAQEEDMAEFYVKKCGMQLTILLAPYLADLGSTQGFLARMFRSVREGEKVILPYGKEEAADFLSWDDLLVLLIRMTDDRDQGNGVYLAASGYRHTWGEVADRLRTLRPDVQVVYENQSCSFAENDLSGSLREKYGFLPMDDVPDDMEEYYQRFLQAEGSGKRFLERVVRTFGKAGTAALRYIEILVFFLLAEGIAGFTSDSVYFRFVDVRLFYIMIVATAWGMRYGVLAAVLECLALVREYSLIGVSELQLFYVIENWLPFAVYVMAGSITGYIRDKKEKEREFAHAEYELLRSKYLFLNDVYQNSLQNKGEYKRQILGFKDSFGKIFDAVQKLDSEQPEKIFLDGLGVLEDILQNQSIAIYSIEPGQRFGRLVVCSDGWMGRLLKSLDLENYQEMMDTVASGEVWKNTRLAEHCPVYAGGVYRNTAPADRTDLPVENAARESGADQLVLLITVWESRPEQYGMDYVNIFHIMCGLVQSAFLKALRYEELQEKENYYPGTNVVYPKRLRGIVETQEAMRIAGTSEYVLFRLPGENLESCGSRLAGLVRATDTLGADEDGCLYLVLTQANRQSAAIVEDRLVKNGISYEIVDTVEAAPC